MSAAVSVIVPVHDHAVLTRRCLDALLSGLPADCEAIVVDDASIDDTPAVLAAYREAIRTVRLSRNGGYAEACNAGAEAANGETLVFLNNDCEPRSGWLEALRSYAEDHPEAAIVGAKLLHRGAETVQHAGVAIGQDGYPHNLYAGFPSDHPAVNRARVLQAVTGACLLVRREPFAEVGGFDAGFLNSLEDVDLCLRIGERGGEVHYCPAAELVHLQSASRGNESRFERSLDLYRRCWRKRVRRDDLAIYAEDGLIELEYPDSYPLPVSVSPLLASLRSAEREPEVERLLEVYARQVSDLLAEVVRLTVELTDRDASDAAAPGLAAAQPSTPAEHRDFLGAVAEAEEEVRRRQDSNGVAPGRRLGYRRLVETVKAEISEVVPVGATVLVVSRGDRELLRLGSRQGGHFPQAPDGGYLGHHPRDGAEAVAQLEALREAGAAYLVLPAGEAWWLDHYAELAEHLDGRTVSDSAHCKIYCLVSNGTD